MALTITKEDFRMMDDRGVETYLNKVYAAYQQQLRGCSSCSCGSLDMSLHSIVAYTQWQQSSEWSGEGDFNVLSVYYLGQIFNNVNTI